MNIKLILIKKSIYLRLDVMWACSFFLPMICELFVQEKDCIAISWMAEFSAFCPSYFWAIGVPKHIDIKSNYLQGLPVGFRRFEDGSF